MKVVKTPERMCISCRQMKPKKALLRLVRTPEDILLIDKGGKQNGRGAYLCLNEECLKKALKSKALERTLKIKPTEELIEQIKAMILENTDAG